MLTYESAKIASLVDQLKRGPVRLRLRQLHSINFLLTVIEPGKAYPFDFVRHTLTGYRQPTVVSDPADDDTPVIGGVALQRDLLVMAEDLSEDADLAMERFPEPLFAVQDLADRFGVSTKTIFRWRRRGLVGWKFRCEDRRSRLAFTESCVRRFVAANIELVNRGSSFSQLTKSEREKIVARAAEMVEAGETTVNAVAKLVSAETGRAVETIRLILKNYDAAHPRAGLFNRPALDVPADDSRLAVWEAHVEGVSVATLAKRFDRPTRWVYDTITEMRARDLKARTVEFVPSDEFELEDADELILCDPLIESPYDEKTAQKARVPGDLPAYLQHLFRLPLLTREGEASLFRQMNYLKFKADKMRQAVDPEDVSAVTLDDIDRLLEQAADVKNRIVQANLRLVVSIAKRHVTLDRDFFEIVSDGNVSLMRAIERFDYSRGFKFSTYGSWAIMKNFARTMPEQRAHRDRYQTGREELLDIQPCPVAEEHENDFLPAVRSALDTMLETLDDRSQSILRQRYGLDGYGSPRTLEQIGNHFGVSKERIRQLEARAMKQLRGEFSEEAAKMLGG